MWVILATSGALSFLVFLAFLAYELYRYRDEAQAQVTVASAILAANSPQSLTASNREGAARYLQSFRADKRIVAAALYDQKGEVLTTYSTTQSRSPAIPGTPSFRYSDQLLHCFHPIMAGNKPLGTLYVAYGFPTLLKRLQPFALVAAVVVLLSGILAYSLSKKIQNVIQKPLLALAQTAHQVYEQDDYSVRATKTLDDDFGFLTDAFNQMLQQIDRQRQEIQSFNQKLEQKVYERTHELEAAYGELKLKNEFVETIIDSSVDIIAVLDNQMCFTAINKRCEEMYGLDRRTVIGQTYPNLFPHAVNSVAYQAIQRALQGEFVFQTIITSAVIPGYFETYSVPLRRGEDVYGVLIISHDVTNLMEANNKLKIANDKLLKSNQELEQFAYVASHDLQEPLRKIQTFAELLRQSHPQPDEHNPYLDKIQASAVRMATLIKDILNFSRLSRPEEAVVPTSLTQVVNVVRSDFDLLIQEKGAILDVGQLPVVAGIPYQLTQLFSNLIGNALKFSSTDPLVRISAQRVPGNTLMGKLNTLPTADYWKIDVSDNGIGFDPKYTRQIFTIFQRLNDARQFTGTGIGLALCKKIVENHQGAIEAESTPGKGATFTIYLPALAA